MNKKNRDDFTEKTKLKLAKRAGWLCSDPECRRPTAGSNSEGDGEIVVGVAAHICAAAPGGPRYDPTMAHEQRRSVDNGIWLCQLHAKTVDSDEHKFTVELLQKWKAYAQRDSWQRVQYNDTRDGGIAPGVGNDELRARLRAAAAKDLANFRRSHTWSANAIPRTLRVEGIHERISTLSLAQAITTLDDLIVIAEPGMGKTTTVFQLAEAALENGHAVPIVIPLGDWSARRVSLLEAILKRASFQEISEGEFRTVAEQPGVLLLLDGWNELDSASRNRAAAELRELERELPKVSLLIATRKQALGVPINGTRVDLEPLSDAEQVELAHRSCGSAGERLLEEAWRTPGMRGILRIPLYVNALLKLPAMGMSATTKEEVLRRLVAAHEENDQKAQALRELTHGMHERYLADLAVTATRAANTTFPETSARRAISETGKALVHEGQIAKVREPRVMLDAFVHHHALICEGEPPGYRFQHQQLQEWYASLFVEQLMCGSVGDADRRDALKVEVLDQRAWEEPILFACERMARGGDAEREACATAILTAFGVDPMLAAEMIFRSTDDVWNRVRPAIMDLVERWHVPGNVDSAVHFMITSGREEFLELVWPLITDEDKQGHLMALRAGARFRPSILGTDASNRIAALSPELRRTFVREIAFNSEIDGLDLVASVAKSDPDTEMKTAVVEALAFRGADRHVADVLHDADDAIFDQLVHKHASLIDHIRGEAVKGRLTAAWERRHAKGIGPYERISRLRYGRAGDDKEAEVTTAIAEVEIKEPNGGIVGLIHELKELFPSAVAKGMLRRVREGRKLPYHTIELMAGTGFAFEDEALLHIALSKDQYSHRAEVAASVLGPHAVGRLIDRMLDLGELAQEDDGHDKEAFERRRAIERRMKFAQTEHLLAAIKERSVRANSRQISEFADLIRQQGDGAHRNGQPFDDAAQAEIARFVDEWGTRLLEAQEATREQLASVAALASHAPSPDLLPVLQRLLDEELQRLRALGEEARAVGYRNHPAMNEWRIRWANWYQGAFLAIRGRETARLMERYLLDKEFGQPAALVLAERWRAAHEPRDDSNRPFFSRVAQKRDIRRIHPGASSAEADIIFVAVEQLIGADATEDARKHAVALGTVAAALPHVERSNILSSLIGMADVGPRRALLTNLVLSGETIDVELVKTGIADVLEAARTQPWIVTEHGELRTWLSLLPFTNRPSEAIETVQGLPEEHRRPDRLGRMIAALTHAPGDEAEAVLFRISELDPRLYAQQAWRDAVCERGTQSSAMHFVDLIGEGRLDCNDDRDQRGVWRRVARLMDEHTDVRLQVYRILEDAATSAGIRILADAVAEKPDMDGLILLIQLDMRHDQTFASWYTVEQVVTERIASKSWEGAYELMPVPAAELRRKLLEMTADGGPSDIPARYLRKIDEARERLGAPESEPRHPDIASGKPWPIIDQQPGKNHGYLPPAAELRVRSALSHADGPEVRGP